MTAYAARHSRIRPARQPSLTTLVAVLSVLVLSLGLGVGLAQTAQASTVTREVTATSLNVRTGASSSHRVVGSLSRGARITGTSSGSWFRIASGTFAGRYVHGGYLKVVSTSTSSSTSSSTPSTVTREVTATSLNVRTGASSSHRVVGSLSRGARITGTSSGSWFRIASGTYAGRYVHGGYLKTVSTTDPRVSRTVNAPGTTIPHTRSQQVMVARYVSGTTGTWARWEWRKDHWYRVDQSTKTAFGAAGVRPAAERVAGDGTTPLGNFGLVHAFGGGAPSGMKMTYRKTTPCSYWIGDLSQSDYNRWREDCAIPSSVKSKSESLYYYSNQTAQRQYRQAVVLDFNYAEQKSSGPGSGSAIFLHYSSSGQTLGCVALMNDAELTRTLQWLDPAKNPQIAVTR